MSQIWLLEIRQTGKVSRKLSFRILLCSRGLSGRTHCLNMATFALLKNATRPFILLLFSPKNKNTVSDVGGVLLFLSICLVESRKKLTE